jgi:SSS family solute:Na+ symporter
LALLKLGYIVDLSVLTSVFLLPLAPVTVLGVWRHGKLSTASSIAAILAIITGGGIGFYGFVTYGAAKTLTMSYIYLTVSAWILITSTTILALGVLVDGLRLKN